MKCPNCTNDVRDTAKFCPHCGHKLATLQETQRVRPPVDAPAPPPPPAKPPVYTPPAAPLYPPPTPAAPARRGFKLPSWPLLAGVAGVLLLALAALWFLFLRGGGAAAGAPQGDRALFYIVADSGSLADSVSAIAGDGETTEVAFARDSLWFYQASGDAAISTSPDGRMVAIQNYDDGEILIAATADGQELHRADGAMRFVAARRFAPDSSALAYTRVETNEDGEQDVTLYAVDAAGEMLHEWPNLVFNGFFADGKRLLATRLDDEGLIDDLVTVALPDGQPARVVTLDDSSGEVDPFVYDDWVYYRHDDELRRIAAGGGDAETVYRFQSDLPFVFLVPGLDKLLVLERSDSERYGDLYLVAPDGSDRLRLDNDVYLYPGQNGSPGPAVATGDGRLAYTAVDNDSLALYVVNSDGSERRRLVDDQAWSSFAFSPDGRWLAYVAGELAGQPGELNVVELPEGDPIRLSRDAWSLLYSGDRLLFSTIDGIESGDPESSIHRTTYEGEEDEVIYGPEDGFIQFISPVR